MHAMPAKNAHLTLPHRAQAHRLAAAVERKRWTQAVFARKVGTTQTTVSRWLTGVVSYADRADALGHLLGVPAAWLLHGTDAPAWASPLIDAAGEATGMRAARDLYSLADILALAQVWRDRTRPRPTVVAQARTVLLRLVDTYPTPDVTTVTFPDRTQHDAEVRRYAAAKAEDEALRAEILAWLDPDRPPPR